MPNITQRNFSSGWRPGDDIINGDPNGMLQMDNVDLDTNGAISLIGGTSVLGTAYTNNLHTTYSRTIGGSRKIYSADTLGGIFRANTSIGTGGATDIAAFGTAFKYVLACSGDTRKKDTGSGTPVNLGIVAPTIAPDVLSVGFDDAPYVEVGSLLANYVFYKGSGSVITSTTYPSGGGHSRPASIKYLQTTADADGNAIVQTTGIGPFNTTIFTEPRTGLFGVSTEDDIFPFCGYVENPGGCSLQIDVILVAPNTTGDQVSDYYTYKIDDLATLPFDAQSGIFFILLKRSDFERVGNLPIAWENVYGFRISFKGTDSQVINFLGNTTNPSTSSLVCMFGGSHSQNGTYEFAQVNVNNTGSYQALSPLGPKTGSITITSNQAWIDPETPTDPQVNEVWIYARSTGGVSETDVSSNLNAWYRVHKQTSSLGATVRIRLSDIEALIINIKYNERLVSIASSSITDKILAIVGPINKRWYYFTTNMMYPSDIDNPDLVDPNIAIRTTGSDNEIFLWSKQVAQATVLVGTSCDVYTLSGTFATLPDFSLDIYYHGLGCKYPPISYDADVSSGSVFYLANDGWRFINESGSNELIVAPVLDKMYKGIACNGYAAPNIKVTPGSTRFPIVIGKNKAWFFITGTNRCEVFDFNRKYWRTFNYNLGDATAVCGTQDGQIVAFYSTDKKLREIDISTSKLIDGVTKQSFTLSWIVNDGGMPRNRKDTSTFKTRCYTGGTDLVSVTINNELNQTSYTYTFYSIAIGLDKFIDLSQDPYIGLCKTYKVKMIGSVSDLLLEDWTINFEPRPEQTNFVRIINQNFGSAVKKRVRNWPLIIDTLGSNVTWTPTVDNINYSSTTLNSTNKDTKNIFYTTDAFGVDYGGTLHSSELFEFYQMLNPNIVQTLPIAKRYDQVGPEEFFKYGKIKQIELRVYPDGGTQIPYTIFMSDTSKLSGTFTVTDGKEDSYYLDVPKGTNGRIARIVFGPTSFNFHRFYVRLQVGDSGKDTEQNWITVAND